MLPCLYLSICALILTISQAKAIRRHNRLTVRPHLATYTETKADQDRKGVVVVMVKLSNNGLGPAFIKTFNPLLDEVYIPADEPDECLLQLKKLFRLH